MKHKSYHQTIVTEEFLDNNPDVVFVFGDNTIRKGKGGAAKLRDHPQAYGFITKKYPNNKITSFFTVYEYIDVFKLEVVALRQFMAQNPDKTFYISKLGAGLANHFRIWEGVIEPMLKDKLKQYADRIVYLWE